MKHSESIGDYAAALATAQGAMEMASKDAKNPFFNSKYADLAAYVGVSRGPLSANGLALVQDVEVKEGATGICVTTMIMHSSGQWMEFTPIFVPVGYIDKAGEWVSTPDAQGVGSAITYGRRYGMAAALGLAAEDDDGNAAVGRQPQAQAKATPKTLPLPTQPPRKDVVLATADQFKALSEFNTHPIGKGLLAKVLKQKNAASAAFLSTEDAGKAIDWINQNIKVREEAAKQAAPTEAAAAPPQEPPVQGETPDERGE